MYKRQDIDKLYDQLIRYQVKIHQQHNDLRELLFKTREITTESSRKGRVLMLMFLDLIDLFERIITSQQDYVRLHETFDSTGILNKYNKVIAILAGELHEVGLAVQTGFPSKPQHYKLFNGIGANFFFAQAGKFVVQVFHQGINIVLRL